jgi:cytochrome c biogenesis DsbD-like protein
MTAAYDPFRCRLLRRIPLALLLGPSLFGPAGADSPDDAVHWVATVQPAATITRGSTLTLDLSGEVGEGWHVYGPEQHSGGPTPLRITLEGADVATTAGPLSGAAAEKVHDTHFGFDTQLYTHPFTVHLPVRVSQQISPGRQLIAVSVRFQACSDRECLLPRTVHLSVPIDVVVTG